MRRIVFAAVLAVGALGAAAVSTTVLPTGWRIGAPQGLVARVGLWPQGIALSPDGSHLAVVDSGTIGPDVRVLDARTLAPIAAIDLKGAFGRPAWIDATHVLVAGQNADAAFVVDITANTARRIDTATGSWPAAVAVAPDGTTVAIANDTDGTLAIASLKGGAAATIPVGAHPADTLFSTDGRTAFVALRGERSVAAVDVASHAVRKIETGMHPCALLLDGSTLYVGNADDSSIAALDTVSGRIVRTIDVRLHGPSGASFGASPTALAADAGHLYAALGQENAVAVIDRSSWNVRRIPTGWYASGVAVARDGSVFISNAKGENVVANPQMRPFERNGSRIGYTGASLFGSIRIAHAADAIDDATFAARYVPAPRVARGIVHPGGPIRHVIYIIKENRTYDQVLGDVAGADGDASLVLFGRNVTPNQHAIVARFGVFDNLYASAQVSADGHNWSTAALANDYLERMWPSEYGGRRQGYDSEDGAVASVPHNGYIWDAAARAHVSLRDYGEFVTNPEVREGDSTTKMPNLIGNIDPKFPGFDLQISDLSRYDEWHREFAGYVRSKNLPALEIVRLGNDHTAGTRPGALTPNAFIAQNDLAVGRIVEAVSHSPYWSSTAIFAIEDDAQNGADHVSNQRTTFYLASPYARRGVHHAHYSTASVLRTIELLLGLQALTSYDLYAPPMDDAFGSTPDLRPFVATVPGINLHAVNTADAYRAKESARMDFTDADAADAATLNDILMHVR